MQYGQATDTQVESAVTQWLDEHPEATTSVEDGSISARKLDPYLFDEDDLMVSGSTVMFSDRDDSDGMGYVILRRGKTFASQVTEENTIYEIRYDFDLSGSTVTIPDGCVLKFEGGSLSNGTLVGQNTNIVSEYYNIFKDSLSVSGTWAVESSKLDWFEPDTNDCYDNAFKKALNVCRTIVCRKKTYSFSGEWIDCRDMYGRFIIYGNNATFRKFHWAYDVTSDNGTHVTSGVENFHNIVKDILFHNSSSGDAPAFFIASYSELSNCNFTGYSYIFAFPHQFYVDNFVWDGGITYMVGTIFKSLKYDFTDGTGFTGDWFFLKNVHHEGYVIQYQGGQSVSMLCENCLHLKFKFTFPNYYYGSRTQLLFNNCHWENLSEMIEVEGTTANINRILDVVITFQNCFFYSSAFPSTNMLPSCTFKECVINLPNNANYTTLNYDKILRKNPEQIRINDWVGTLAYDSLSFEKEKNKKITGRMTPANAESYYLNHCAYAGNSSSSVNYTESHTASYLVGWSMSDTVLYNDGDTPTMSWSSNINVDAGEVVTMELYMRKYRAAYLHIYKKDITNNVVYRIILPSTGIYYNENSHDSIGIVDTKLGVYGKAWETYEGALEDIHYVASLE